MALLPQPDPLDEEALTQLLGGDPRALVQHRLAPPIAQSGPVVRKPQIESESVFDSPTEKAWKVFQHLLGHDGASCQVMGAAGANIELPGAMEGPIVKGAKLGGKALGDLVATLKASQAGQYALKSPTMARVRDIYKLGTSLPRTSNWTDTANELLEGFGGDKEKARQWLRLWGATSPNTSVPVNTRESVSALAHALENPGRLLDVATAQNLPDAKITMAPSKVPNINRALAGEPLSGDKVEAMAGY